MLRLALLLSCLLLVSVPAVAQEPAAAWAAVNQPAFDSGRSAAVSNVQIVRDRIRITLISGTLEFAEPLAGRPFAAVFTGTGKIEVEPPNATEAQQLFNNSGQRSMNMEFTEATFTFSDELFSEISKQVNFAGSGSLKSGELYGKRQKDREDVGAEMVPRIFKGLLSQDAKRSAYFAADVKTRDKGWVLAQFDAQEPEQVRVGRWANWGLVDRFDVWMQFPAGGIPAAQAFHDPLALEDIRVGRYKISATVTQSAELQAEASVQLDHRVSGERVLLFELDANLRVESVKDSQGAALPFFQPRDPGDRIQSFGDYIAVVLPAAATRGLSQTISFRYAGKNVVRKEGSGNFFCQSYGWYPTRPTSFVTRADFEMIFRSPKKYTMVATGNRVSETTDGDWSISTWASDLPLTVAGFAYGDYKLVTEKVGEIDVEIYANKEGDDIMKSIQNVLNPAGPRGGRTNLGGAAIGTLTPAALAKPMATEISNTIRIFENYFGPYPYKRLAVTSLPLGYSYGQGWPTLIYLWSLSFLDAQQRHTLGVSEHTELTDFFRAHESSHQWWGHRVSWKSYHDQWLSEGFAQFSGNLYVQFRKGEKEYVERLKQDRADLKSASDSKNRRMESLGPIWMGTRISSADAPRAYSFLIYTKGGYVLSMIRMMLYNNLSQNPDERFITLMREFTSRHNNQPASTEDFKALVEKHMLPSMDLDQNKKMDWFFNQYVYGTGIPEYTFRHSVEATADNKWKVSGTVTRSGVAETWKDSLPLYFTRSGRTAQLGWLMANQTVTPFEFVLPFKPEKLVLNVNEDILADIKQ